MENCRRGPACWLFVAIVVAVTPHALAQVSDLPAEGQCLPPNPPFCPLPPAEQYPGPASVLLYPSSVGSLLASDTTGPGTLSKPWTADVSIIERPLVLEIVGGLGPGPSTIALPLDHGVIVHQSG